MKKIVMFSGGKDSTAMLLRMLELNMKIDKIIFCNTTLEYPDMYKYIDRVEKSIGIKIEKVFPKNSFNHWFYGRWTRGKNEGKIRGMPYTIGHSWCCREFKVNPSRDFKGSKDCIFYIGITKGEERRIQKDPNIKYPLIEWGWTEKKCLKYTKEKGLYNKLYNHFDRLGCWLCPKQSMKSLKVLYEHYPLLWKQLKQYEKDSPIGFHPQRNLKELEKDWKQEVKDEPSY